jgi:PadR family transcriptional regulator PadR
VCYRPGVKGEHVGEFEELILLTVYGLGREAYGVTIQEAIERAAERQVSIGAVYAALDRLERKGYVKSRTGGQTKERGGRRKRFFTVSRSGVAVLGNMRRIRERMWQQIEDGTLS